MGAASSPSRNNEKGVTGNDASPATPVYPTAPRGGFEPPTPQLTAECSAAELTGNTADVPARAPSPITPKRNISHADRRVNVVSQRREKGRSFFGQFLSRSHQHKQAYAIMFQ